MGRRGCRVGNCLRTSALIDSDLANFLNRRGWQGSMSTRQPSTLPSPNPASIHPHHLLTSLAAESLGKCRHVRDHIVDAEDGQRLRVGGNEHTCHLRTHARAPRVGIGEEKALASSDFLCVLSAASGANIARWMPPLSAVSLLSSCPICFTQVYSTLPAAGPTAVACLVLGSMPISATPPTPSRPMVTTWPRALKSDCTASGRLPGTDRLPRRHGPDRNS
jgi:hypothetical protein